MKGDDKIDRQTKGPFLKRKKGNQIIDWITREWKVVGMDSELGKIEFLGGKNRVTVKINLTTVDLIACDAQGNQKTFRLIGFEVPEE